MSDDTKTEAPASTENVTVQGFLELLIGQYLAAEAAGDRVCMAEVLRRGAHTLAAVAQQLDWKDSEHQKARTAMIFGSNGQRVI